MDYPCLDCFCDTLPDEVDFSVHDKVWLQAVPGDEGHLCIHCLKTRLQRDLQLSDFLLGYEVNSHITQEFLDSINVR
jgi:hypothetical protein